MKTWTKLLLAVGLLWLAACTGGADVDQPPEILYGQDVCDRCNMIINEERYAAAYWTTSGQARRFDDVGGMLLYLQEEGEEVAAFWVHDYNTGEWIRAEEATLLMAPGWHTPMGFGLVACATEAGAQSLAAETSNARVLSFDQALNELAEGTLTLAPAPAGQMHMHESDG